MTKHVAYIGIGSNLQEPIVQVKKAIWAIAEQEQIVLLKQSSLYMSDSLLEGQPRYINAVVCVETNLSPFDLLKILQQIELDQGRERHEHWGARTLDLDVLLYDDWIIEGEVLTVPHAQMAVRSFVLVPLSEIAVNLSLPSGDTVKQLLIQCPAQCIEKLLD